MSNYQKSSTLDFGIVKLASDSTPESDSSLPITNYTLGLRLAAFSGAATSTTSGVISLTSATLNSLSGLATNGILTKTATGTTTWVYVTCDGYWHFRLYLKYPFTNYCFQLNLGWDMHEKCVRNTYLGKRMKYRFTTHPWERLT